MREDGEQHVSEKLFQKCLGIIDEFEKHYPKLDAISSIPPFENSSPCPRVRTMRKATVNEIKKQLAAADALKLLAAAMTDHMKNERSAAWPDKDAIPVIPEIIAPVECKSDNTSSTGEKPDPTSAKAGSEPGASISASDSDPVFQVPEDFGFLELLILGCLCLGLGE